MTNLIPRRCAALWLALASAAWALPPTTLIDGGIAQPASSSLTTIGAWHVYAATNSSLAAAGTLALSPESLQREGFEAGDFSAWPWTFGGTQPWAVQSSVVATGSYAAVSGSITHSQSSAMQAALNCVAGTISFAYKVSSEAGFDFLEFYMDGVLKGSWSGEQGWSYAAYPVAAGGHTFRWKYAKDSSISSGSDSAWIDRIAVGRQAAASVWWGDVGAALGTAGRPGDEHVAILTSEDGAGTSAHVGYCAAMSHVLDGNDPAEFRTVTLRPIPVPSVAVTGGYSMAVLAWNALVADAGEGGVTNVVGYDVHRSADGRNFTRLNADTVRGNRYTDVVAYAAEYFYALSPVFRGSPEVHTTVLSANSARPLMLRDADADGIPDWWTMSYFGHATGRVDDLSRAIDDASGTGQNNLYKYIAALDPRAPTSAFAIVSISDNPPRSVVTFSSSPIRLYSLRLCTNLLQGAWGPASLLAPVAGSSGNRSSLTDTNQVAPRFYRVRVHLP